MTPPVAVYDACVLYPAPLRDLLVRVALAGLVRAHWTDQIHDEWTRNVLANRPELAASSIERSRRLMDAHVHDALVVGYENLIPGLTLPDPDDRHVLAAAVHSGAGVVVTFNLSDFPPTALAPHSIEAVHPDEFVMRMLDGQPRTTCEAVRQQRLALKKPPKTVEEFLPVLAQCGLVRTAAALHVLADAL
jgi:predicted nucleic acid-binding protein